MKRGDLVTVALSSDYGKPRPALVIQSNLFAGHPSLTLLPLTSELRETPIFRVRILPDPAGFARVGAITRILPDPANGLRAPSDVMIDKPHTVAREKIRDTIGAVSDEHLIEIERAMAVWLGIAD